MTTVSGSGPVQPAQRPGAVEVELLSPVTDKPMKVQVYADEHGGVLVVPPATGGLKFTSRAQWDAFQDAYFWAERIAVPRRGRSRT